MIYVGDRANWPSRLRLEYIFSSVFILLNLVNNNGYYEELYIFTYKI